MSMTEPQMRAEVVAQVAAMSEPVAAEPAPVVDETPAEVAEAPADVAEEAADVVNEDNPDSQDQDVDGAEGPTEDENAEGQAQPAADAPQFWPDEAKADFANLSAEAQEALVKHYKTAQTQINAKFEEAAAVRKTAETQAEALKEISARVEQAATQAEETFRGRWDGMTDQLWLQLSRESPQEYIQLRAQYDAEQNALQQANAAKEAAARVERQNWLSKQADDLKTYAPELVDPVSGKAKFEKTIAYLRERGAAEQDLTDVSAAVLALAYDSMQLQELRKNKPKPNPATPPKPGLAPAAATAAVPPEKRQLDRLQNRFNQTANRGDAVALLMAKGVL